MATKFDSTKPDLINQTIPEAFDSCRENDVSQDTAIARDHYPASEKDDALRGTHKLLTFNTVSILTSHPDTKAGELKFYIYQDSTGRSLYTRDENNAVPKMYPGFFAGSFLKSINKMVGDKDADFTIAQSSTGEVTVTNGSNGLTVGLSQKTIDEIAKIATNAAAIATNASGIATNGQAITALDSRVSSNKTAIDAVVLVADKNKSDIAQLQIDVPKNTSSINTLTAEAATHLTGITSTDGSVTIQKSGQSVDLSVPAPTASGVTKLNSLAGDITIEKSTATGQEGILVTTNSGSKQIDIGLSPADLAPNLVSASLGNAITAKADGLYAPTGGGSAGVSSVNGMVGDIENIAAATNPTIQIDRLSAQKQLQYSVKISADANNALSAKADGLYATASGGSSGVDSVNGLTSAVLIQAKSTTTPTILVAKNSTDNAVDLSVPISSSANNALSAKADGLFVSGSGSTTVTSADDVVETVYLSSRGLDSNTGTLIRPFKTLEASIKLAETKKLTINDKNPIYIVRKGDSTSDSRDVTGNTVTEAITNGKITLDLPQTNFVDSALTLHVTTAVDANNDLCTINMNEVKKSSFVIGLDTVATEAEQKEQINYIFNLSSISKSTTETQPTILVKKIDAGDANIISCVKNINIFINNDLIIEDAAVASSAVQCTPIVELEETGLSNAQLFAYYRNLSQNSDQVLELTQIQKISPIIKSGTPDSTNPVTLKLDLEIADLQSKLFRLPTAQEYDSGKIVTDLLSKLNNLDAGVITAQTLQIPTAASAASSIGLQNEKVRYKDVNSKDWTVATEKYVQDEIAKSGGGGSSTIIATLNDAVFFYSSIQFDPISSVCYCPKITWNSLASGDYKDQSVIDPKYPNFETTESVFNYRAIDSRSSTGTVFPKQLWLSDFDGTGAEGKRFFGIAHMKILTGSTVTVTAKAGKYSLHTLTFTSSESLSYLQDTFIQGTWLELAADDAKSRFVTGVIASPVTSGSAGSFSLDANFIFTNSKLQSSMYDLADLSARTVVNIYINPFPSVIPKETTRFDSSVPNGAEANVTQNYFMVGVEASDVLKEAIILIPYSPAYASLTATTKRANIGEFLFSAKNIQKPVIDKLSNIWSEKLTIGINPMPIPSYVNGDTYRSLLGSMIDMEGNKLKLSYPYNPDGISVLHANNPTEFMGSMKDITIDPSDEIINCGYQLASFEDLNDITMKVSAPYTSQDADLYGFLQEGDVESIFIGSSFNSLSNTVNGKSRSVIIMDRQLMNINAVADDPVSKYLTMRGAIYTKNSSLRSITLHIDGWTVSNALYGNLKARMLTVVGENPLPPVATPTDDEMTTFGFRSQSDIGTFIGTFYKADGTPTGQLT